MEIRNKSKLGGIAVVATRAAAQTPRQARRLPAVSGNLALASSPSDDDWTDF